MIIRSILRILNLYYTYTVDQYLVQIQNSVLSHVRANLCADLANLRVQFLGNSTFLHTLFWPKFAFFWPQGPRLGLKYQKHSVTSCLGPKPSISELNLVPYGNWQFWVLLTPQKPSGAPRAPQRAPEGQKRHKSSLISPIINFHAKKSHFKGVGFFSVFSLGMTPKFNEKELEMQGAHVALGVAFDNGIS